MEQSNIRSNRWNVAAKYGLVFGAVSIAYFYITHLQIAGIIGFVLWAAKFVGCIKLMQYVMKKFASDNPSAVRSDIFKLGALISCLSALVFSAATVVDILYLFPDYYQAAYATIIDQYSKTLSTENIEMLKTMLANMPKYTFLGNLIYCSIFGTILSFILSRSIPSKDPFHNYKPDEQ
jgi:hypothetical protein